MRRRVLPIGLLACAIGFGVACSGDDDDSAGPTTSAPEDTTSAPSSSSAPDASDPQGTAPPGCAGPGPEIPRGATTGPVVDVDQDGREDTAWVASTPDGRREVGIRTAAAGGASAAIESASPAPLRILVADADQRPPVEIFVDDNRSVQLWAFADCTLQPVMGPDGRPYIFDRGFRGTGTGVGCVDVDDDGTSDLVGLNVVYSDPSEVTWSRTVVELDGFTATDGDSETGSFRRDQDGYAIDLLYAVTCGDLVAIEDGVGQRP